MIKQWLEKRRHKAARERFDRGFDYAAGELLRGTDTESLEARIDGAQIFGDDNEFDEGMAAAIVAWENYFPPERNVTMPLMFPALAA